MDRVRYRSDSPDVMAEALLSVVQYARESDEDFTFGPISLKALDRDGLVVKGDNLRGVLRVLNEILGLVAVEVTSEV